MSMGRRLTEIKAEAVWQTSTDPNAILPWVRATQILMLAQARQAAREETIDLLQVTQEGLNKEPGKVILPFDDYPESGRGLLGRVKGSNCRHGYGLQFMRITGQTRCAYCDLDFAASYQNWLQMALDHVVPTRTGTEKCIPAQWLDDCSNKVLACAACNGFRNRYTLVIDDICPATLDEFFDLRNRVFRERKDLVMESHQREQAFFAQSPWTS